MADNGLSAPITRTRCANDKPGARPGLFGFDNDQRSVLGGSEVSVPSRFWRKSMNVAKPKKASTKPPKTKI